MEAIGFRNTIGSIPQTIFNGYRKFFQLPLNERVGVFAFGFVQQRAMSYIQWSSCRGMELLFLSKKEQQSHTCSFDSTTSLVTFTAVSALYVGYHLGKSARVT